MLGLKACSTILSLLETMSRIAQAGTILSSLKWVVRRLVGLLCWEHRTEGCPDESFILHAVGEVDGAGEDNVPARGCQ